MRGSMASRAFPARANGGTWSATCAWRQETGCPYHVCHVSTKESVALIRQAKARGVDVTCETATALPAAVRHGAAGRRAVQDEPAHPFRSRTGDALVAGLLDGTIDILATDHAPHSAEEKARGLEESLMGVVGLECAFPVLYTGLALTGSADAAGSDCCAPMSRRAARALRFALRRIEPGAGDICDL